MGITISGATGIDMGDKPISNASQIDSTTINENGANVRTESDSYNKTEVDGKVVGFKNLLINPNFLVNQRGYVSGTATTIANQYCHDRWRVPTSGLNVTFATTNGVTTVTASASGYEQIIENLNNIGGTFFLSNQGTAIATVSQSSDNITYTNVTPNADGSYTVTGGNYIKIKFTSGTIIKPQFEQGTKTTVFENRSHSLELSLSQRYYYKLSGVIYSFISHGMTGNTNKAWTVVQIPVSLRSIPTVSFLNIGAWYTSSGNFSSGATAVAIIGYGLTAFDKIPLEISGIASISTQPLMISFSGNGYLIFDSEL